MSHDFKSSMDILDRSASRPVDLSIEDLLAILKTLHDHSAYRQEFTDLRIGLWFRQVAKHLPRINGNQLIELEYLISQHLGDSERYYSGFFHDWEHALSKRVSEIGDPISILRMYEHEMRDMPEEIIVEWCRVTSRKIDTMSPEQLVEIMELYTSLKLRPDDDFVERWARKMESTINGRKLNDDQLANTIYACGKLDVHLLNRAFSKTLADRSTTARMNASQMAKVIYGCLLLKIDIGREMPDLVAHFYDVAARHMESLEPRTLCQAMWAVGRVPEEPPQEFATNWNRQFTIKAGACTAKDLTLAMEGLKSMADRGHQISAPLMSTWIHRAETVVADFWPQALARILVDLSHVQQQQPNREFVRKCLHMLRENLEHVYARDYAMMMISMAKMRVDVAKMDPEFVRAWKSEASKHGKHDKWSAELKRELAMALESLGISVDRSLIS